MTGLFLLMLMGGFTPLSAQEDSVKSNIESFIQDFADSHEKKYLNLQKRKLAGIYDTEFEWKDEFMLKSKEEFENNLGYTTERKIYFSVFNYYSELDRQYALKYWMENFIEDEDLRPSRKVRSMRYATPTIILINPTSIIVCNYDCKYYSYENFNFWKDKLLEHFEVDETMVIEILCDGPLEWTKNAPDPKTRGLF